MARPARAAIRCRCKIQLAELTVAGLFDPSSLSGKGLLRLPKLGEANLCWEHGGRFGLVFHQEHKDTRKHGQPDG